MKHFFFFFISLLLPLAPHAQEAPAEDRLELLEPLHGYVRHLDLRSCRAGRG